MRTKILINLGMALIVGAGIWFGTHHNQPPPKPVLPTGSIPDKLPPFTLMDTEGVQRNNDEWRGKVLVVNFWATWCPPCLKEMPTFIQFQEKYGSRGLQIVGVAVDNLDPVKEFIDTYGINFPVVIGDDDAIQLSQKMGNRISALPFTAIFDRSGKTHYIQPGLVTPETLEKELKPLL